MPEILDIDFVTQEIFKNISGLNFDIIPFTYFDKNKNRLTYAGLPAQTVNPNVVTYFELDDFGVLTSNQVGFTQNQTPVGSLVSNGATITKIEIFVDAPFGIDETTGTTSQAYIVDNLDATYTINSFNYYDETTGNLLSFGGLANQALPANDFVYITITGFNTIATSAVAYPGGGTDFAKITTNGASEIILIEYNTPIFTAPANTNTVVTLGLGGPIRAIQGTKTFDVLSTAFTNTLSQPVISVAAFDIDPPDGTFTYVSWDDAGNVVYQTGNFQAGTTAVGIVLTAADGEIIAIYTASGSTIGILDPATIDVDETPYINLVSGAQITPELLDDDPLDGADTYYELTAGNAWNIVPNGPYTNGNTPGLLARVNGSGVITRVFDFLTNPPTPIVPGAAPTVFNVNAFTYVDTLGISKLFLGAAAVDPVDNDTNYVSVTDPGVLTVNTGGFPTNETPVGIVYTDGAGNITNIINFTAGHDPSKTIDLPSSAYIDLGGLTQYSDELINYDPADGAITYIELDQNGDWQFQVGGPFTLTSTPIALVVTDGSGNITAITLIGMTTTGATINLNPDWGQHVITATAGEVDAPYALLPKKKVFTVNGNIYYIVKTQEFVENVTDGIAVVLDSDGTTVLHTYTMNKTTRLLNIT